MPDQGQATSEEAGRREAGRVPSNGRAGADGETRDGDGAPPLYEHLRVLFDHAFQFIGLFSPEGEILEVNPSALEFAGLERSEVVGRPAWETPWLPEDPTARRRLRRAVEEAAGGTFVRYTTRIVGPGGREAAIDFSLTPVRDEGGEVAFLVSEGRNISAQKEAERALRISRSRLSAILRSALDAIVAVDEEERIQLFNEGAERVFGYDRNEVLGRPLSILIPEGLRGVHRDHFRDFARSAVVARPMRDRGIVGRRKGGEEFPAEASIAKVDVGGARLYTAVLRDITERRKAERERERLLARERQARWRAERAERRTHFLSEASVALSRTLEVDATLETVADLAVPELADICVVDVVGEGDRLRRAVVRDPSAKVGREPAALIPGEDPAADGLVRRVLGMGKPILVPRLGEAELAELSTVLEERTRLEERGVHSLMVVPLAARDTTLGVLCLLTAESGRELGEEELAVARELASRAAFALDNARLYAEAQKATKARDEMLRVVSHDLRNPITGVLMGARMLERRLGSDPDELGELVEGVHLSAVRLNRLVRDLADVASAERGGLSIEPTPQPVPPVVREAVRAVEGLAEERAIDLRVRVEGDLPAVSVDRDRILQVLSNLLDNALKFTPEGGRVDVRVAPGGSEEGMVRLSVSDTGPGIPEEDREHVFERFWRGAGPSGTGKAGTGLGLAIAKGIVQTHGGRIWVESAPGEGSTFAFTLPVAGGAEAG